MSSYGRRLYVDIKNAKEILDEKYVGQHGIHGYRVRKREGMECFVILHVPAQPLSWDLKREIIADIAPFGFEFRSERERRRHELK